MIQVIQEIAVTAAATLAANGRPLTEAHGDRVFLGLPFWIWQTINLALFLGLLVYLLARPLRGFFASRREEIAKQQQQSQANRAKAEELGHEIQRRLASIDGELAALKARAETEGNAEQVELEARGREEAEKFLQQAGLEIDNRTRAAKKELAAYAGDLAVEMARDLVQKKLTPADQKRLVEDGLGALGARR